MIIRLRQATRIAHELSSRGYEPIGRLTQYTQGGRAEVKLVVSHDAGNDELVITQDGDIDLEHSTIVE